MQDWTGSKRLYSVPVERHVKERLIGAAVLAAAAIILIPEMLSGTQPKQAQRPGTQATNPTAQLPPSQLPEPVAQNANGEAPLKTYTIDLSKTPTALPAGGLDERAPPTEMPLAPESALPAQVGPGSSTESSAEPSGGGTANTSATNSVTPATTAATVAPSAGVENPASETRTDDKDPSKDSKPTAGTASRTVAPASVEPARTSSVKPATRANAPAVAAPPARSGATPALEAAAKPVATGGAAGSGAGAAGWAIQMGSFSSRATADRMAKQLRASGQEAFVMPVKSGAATLYRVRVGPIKDRQAAQQLLGKLKAVASSAAIVPHP